MAEHGPVVYTVDTVDDGAAWLVIGARGFVEKREPGWKGR